MAQATIRTGGAPTEAENLVSADQETITGDGTSRNPLKSSGVVFTGVTPAVGGAATIVPGQVLKVGGSSSLPAGSRPVRACDSAHVVVGIALGAAGPAADQPVKVQSGGIVTLTGAEWQAVRDDGLVPTAGDVMFVSQTTAGNLTTTAPSAGQTTTMVGVFLNSTDLKLLNGPPLLGSAY